MTLGPMGLYIQKKPKPKIETLTSQNIDLKN
jgi:hypothetical protein